MADAVSEFVTYEVVERIAIVRIDHGKANTLSSEVVAALDVSIRAGVLNLFAYAGGFTVAALHGGASRVDQVDVSARVATWAARNVAVGHSRARLGGGITLFVVYVGVWLLALLLGEASDSLDHPSAVLLMSPPWAWAATLQAYQHRGDPGTLDVTPALRVGALAWAAVAAVGWTRAVTLWLRARREEKNG